MSTPEYRMNRAQQRAKNRADARENGIARNSVEAAATDTPDNTTPGENGATAQDALTMTEQQEAVAAVELCGNCINPLPCGCAAEAAAAEAIEKAKATPTDVITIVRDVEGKLGKRFWIDDNGKLHKKAVVHLSVGRAEMRHVPDHAALRAILLELGDDPHAAVINGRFKGVEIGEPFLIASRKKLSELVKSKREEDIIGVHRQRPKREIAGFPKGSRVKIVGRLKENIEPSTWQILDRDVDEHTPAELATPEFDWLAAVDRILPGLQGAARTRTCSSSARVFRDGVAVGNGNGHVWVQITDPDDAEQIRAAAIVRAAECGLSWLKPKHCRKTGEVTGHAITTLFDVSVWDRARLIFVGAPQAGAGLSVGAQAVQTTEGVRLDTSLATIPESPERIKEITRAAGVPLTLRKENGRFVFDEFEQLRLTTELELQGQRTMTVAEYMEQDVVKFRCQAPFRASESWAAFTGRSSEGRPFVHDSGTNTNHWLCQEDWLRTTGFFDDCESAPLAVQEEEQTVEGAGATSPAATPPASPTSFPSPFPGLMADVVEAVLDSALKPQPELTLLAVLIGMASACDGARFLPSDGRLNLYGVGVSQTGTGKEQPRQAATALARVCGANLLGKPASGQGLEDALVEGVGMLVELDEIAHVLEALNGTNKPPHLVELSSVLLRLYSASSTTYSTRVRAQARGVDKHRTVAHPCLNLLGFATPETLGRALTMANIEDGLLGRLLFAPGQPDVRPRRSGKRFEMPASVADRARLLRSDLAAFNDGDGSIQVSESADALLEQLMLDFDTAMRNSTEAFARALLVRSFEKCERIAGVLAVFDRPTEPMIDLQHVEWAAQFVRASDNAILQFCAEFMHGGKVQADAALVLRLTKRVLRGEFKLQRKPEFDAVKHKMVHRSTLLRASKLDKRELDEALEYLSARGDLCELIDKTEAGKEVRRHRYFLV